MPNSKVSEKFNENNFDILRLLLAVVVFFAHWNILTAQNITNQIFHSSGYAVDMFFIISGFLIFWSFDNNQNIKSFFIKRFFRIFPLYAFLIFLQTIFFVWYSNGTYGEIAKYFTANILFLNFLSYSVGDTLNQLQVNAINGSLWTLKNEVIFYLFVPLIFKLYKRMGVVFLFILYILSVIYMFGVDYIHVPQLLVQFPSQLRLFLVGILLYLFLDKINDKNIKWLTILSFISIVFFYQEEYFRFSIYPLLLGILMIFLVYFTKTIKINFDFSYSFYILHFPIIQLSLYFGLNPKNPIVSFVSIFLFILFLSYYSEKYIEKKFVKLGKSLIKNNIKKRNKSATN